MPWVSASFSYETGASSLYALRFTSRRSLDSSGAGAAVTVSIAEGAMMDGGRLASCHTMGREAVYFFGHKLVFFFLFSRLLDHRHKKGHISPINRRWNGGDFIPRGPSAATGGQILDRPIGAVFFIAPSPLKRLPGCVPTGRRAFCRVTLERLGCTHSHTHNPAWRDGRVKQRGSPIL